MRRKFKKITLPAVMGLISFYTSVFFLLGAIIGFLAVRYFSAKVKSVRFSLKNYQIHFHHWFLAALSLFIIFIAGVYSVFPIFLLGLGSGVVFEGIYSYNDWYKIVYRAK